MKKFVWLMLAPLFFMFTACTAVETATEAVYNGAMVTTSSMLVYKNFDNVNTIISSKLEQMDAVDRVKLKAISTEFADIKSEFDKITNNAVDIYKVTMNLDKYIATYNKIEANYVTARDILKKYPTLFSEEETTVLTDFDKYAVVLYEQVNIVKTTISDKADSASIDITSIMEKTVNILTAFATIATVI